MSELQLDFEPRLDEALSRLIADGVDDHNMAMTGHEVWHPVNCLLRSTKGEVMGGLLGHVWGGWLEVKSLWVAASYRGRGQATRLLAAAEAHAAGKGARSATLDTHNSRAQGLYERLGYIVIGRLEDYPPGFSKVFMRKALV